MLQLFFSNLPSDLFVKRQSSNPRWLVVVGMASCLLWPALAGAERLTVEGSTLKFPSAPLAQEGASFGHAMAVGDFNADGYQDLAVGIPGAASGGQAARGGVQVLFGSPSGPGNVQTITSVHQACPVDDVAAEMGYALAVGDFDANGADDLVVGLPGFSLQLDDGTTAVQTGAVAFYAGFDSSQGGGTLFPAQCLHQGRDEVPGSAGDGHRFGSVLATGDFDADGRSDLVIGAPDESVGGFDEAGSITVIYGAGIVNPNLSERFDQDTPGIPGMVEAGDRFGASLAVYDFLGGDQTGCDLAVGVPGEDFQAVDEGVVHLLFGCRPNDGLSTLSSKLLSYFGGSTLEGLAFGTSLAAGRVAGPDVTTLCVGAPGLSALLVNPEGQVEVYEDIGGAVLAFGDFLDKPLLSDLPIASLDSSAAEWQGGERGGEALAVGNLARGRDKLLIGAPSLSRVGPAQGRAFVFSNDPFFSARRLDLGESGSPAAEAAGDRLGKSLVFGDFGGGFYAAIGLPGRVDQSSGLQTGAVWLLTADFLFEDGFETGDLSGWSSFQN